jgi:hypothetical protein
MEDILKMQEELAKKLGVTPVSIEEVFTTDCIEEYLDSVENILMGLIKMGVKVHEYSIPVVAAIFLDAVKSGPDACTKLALKVLEK